MTVSATLAAELPALQPDDAGQRLFLFAFRQMGAHGLNDACAAHAFVTAFGKDFRRPLVLLRALMREMSLVAANPLRIAPWCCPRMTRAETTLLAVMARAEANPAAAATLLADLLGTRSADGILPTAQALAAAFADLALPLSPRS